MQRRSLKSSSNKTRRRFKLSTVVAAAVAIPALTTVAILFAAFTATTKEQKIQTKLKEKQQQQFQAPANVEDKVKQAAAGIPEAVSRTEDKAKKSNHDVEYHIIFSTGCSLFQDWQSYVFFHAAMMSKQPGTITRIVSGCSEEDEKTLTKLFDEQIRQPMGEHNRIHFTPDYSGLKKGHSYKYWNKPFGTKHWLENVLGFPDNPVNPDAIVVLMDPDQIILRPFTNNDFSNTIWMFTDTPRTKIEHGKPMGQLYGFGLQWKQKINMSLVTNETSPVDSMSTADARAGYTLGPPYIATASDMYKIVTKWCDFAVPVHDQYPHLLAEMFAYCLSAAHQLMSHQTAASFMVSDVGAHGEGWPYIDKMESDKVCGIHDPEELPNVLHFCQRYCIGSYFFGKYRLPKSFLTCESPLLPEPPVDVLNAEKHVAIYPDGTSKELDEKVAKRNAFMVCQMNRAMNAAATFFKQHHCNETNANYDKALIW